MQDLPRIFQAFADTYEHPTKGRIRYGYGDIHNLNLIVNETAEDPNQIFMLVEPCTRSFTFNSDNTQVSRIVFSGAFSMVINSSIDEKYFNEVKENEETTITDDNSKYTEHIEPLVHILPSLVNHLLCTEVDVNQFDAIDLVNYLDENRDGVLIRYRLSVPYIPNNL